jgi:hypothetical protein
MPWHKRYALLLEPICSSCDGNVKYAFHLSSLLYNQIFISPTCIIQVSIPVNGKERHSRLCRGIGLIGGGAILRRGNLVLGVTMAATLWFVTVMGLCLGGGQMEAWLGLAGVGQGSPVGIKARRKTLEAGSLLDADCCGECKRAGWLNQCRARTG